MTKAFNPQASCYCLVLNHEQPETVEIGALGPIDWPKGWLYYAGRASRGWTRRFKRFIREDTRRFWHIDYLVNSPESFRDSVFLFDFPPERECEISRALGKVKGLSPLTAGAGSTDCEEGCPAHAWEGQVRPREVQTELSNQDCAPTSRVIFHDDQSMWEKYG